jgi:hypothetical protein
MKRKKAKPVIMSRERCDRRLLIFFSFWVLLGLLFSVTGGFIPGGGGIGSLIPSFIESLAVAFFFSGILAIKYHRKRGIIPGKRLLKWFAKISLVIGLVVAVVMSLLLTQTTIFGNEFPELSGPEMMAFFLVMYIFGFLFSFFAPLFLMINRFWYDRGLICYYKTQNTRSFGGNNENHPQYIGYSEKKG